MAEYEIVLQLQAPAGVEDDALEGHMMDVLGVVELHAEDVALGPVVSVDLGRHHIDLGFCVEAASLEQANTKVAEVLQTIEQHTDVQFTPTAASSTVATESAGCSLMPA
jgi:hypothetical protein